MGTSKKIDENGEFIGKTLSKIIENSNFPILTVPTSSAPIQKKSLNVLYATNFYEKDNSSLNNLLKILQPFEKKIQCVHIDMHDDSLHRQKVHELNSMLEKEYSNYHIKCELFESENVPKGICEFVEQNKIDIISLSKLKRSAIYKMFHSNLLEKLISENKVPVLIFPV
jgi:nucleotide-binding universal stress UspA family protein